MIRLVAAVHSSQDWGLWAAVFAVIADSIVTIIVGIKLNKTARREVNKALDTVQPALKRELSNAVVNLLPVVVQTLQQHLGANREQGSGTIPSIGNNGTTTGIVGTDTSAANRDRATEQ